MQTVEMPTTFRTVKCCRDAHFPRQWHAFSRASVKKHHQTCFHASWSARVMVFVPMDAVIAWFSTYATHHWCSIASHHVTSRRVCNVRTCAWRRRTKHGADSHASNKCRRSWNVTSASTCKANDARRMRRRGVGADDSTCRELIGRINANHDSRDPERLRENVALIRELNDNIAHVVELSRHVSVDLKESVDKSTTQA